MNRDLSCLSEALPVSGRALFLRVNFNHSLIQSLQYLLEACSEVIPDQLVTKTNQTLNSLIADFQLSGFLSALHADFLDAANQQDVPRIQRIVKRLSEDNFQIKKIKYINFSNLDEYYSLVIGGFSSQELERTVEHFSLSSKDFKRVKQSIEHGFKVLERVVPAFFQEAQELINEVLIFNSNGLKGGSSINFFGMVYISLTFQWEKITDALSFITHEQAHLYVHLLTHNDPLLLNPSERYESPLRAEKRPLIGNYHATFVLARIIYVLNKAFSLNEIPENEKEYCTNMLDYYKKRFYIGLEILKNHAQMTPLGNELILSASKLL